MEFSITPDHCRVCLKKASGSKLLADQNALELPSTAGTEIRSYMDIYILVAAAPTSSAATFFPQRICDNCEAQLLVAYEFRRKSRKSERVLLNILSFYEDESRSLQEETVCVKNRSVIGVEEAIVEYSESSALLDSKDSAADVVEKEPDENVDYHQIEHNFEVVTDTGLDQDQEIGYIIEEFTDDGQESESDEEDHDHEFYEEVQFSESKSKSSPCPDCGKIVSTRYLTKHREIHRDKCDRVKPFECDQCHATFTLKENLQKHKRIHSNDKKYSCPYCNLQFLHWASRRYHIDSRHTGEKRFTCEYCGAKFRNSSHYSVHLRRHKGLTPFPCHLCDRSFTTGNSLKLHLVSHSDTKNFICEKCTKSYKTAKSLRIHKKTTHEQEKNYVCPVCDRAYSQNHVLKTHMLRNHPHYEPPPPGTVVNVRAVKRMHEQLAGLSG